MTDSRVTAVLGPTNTGKTHLAVERLRAHSSGMMGFPLRLLAREVYDRVVAIKGPREVALITGEERIAPEGARWLICTAESMPANRDLAFVALDEAQLGADRERGHVFTDRLLHARGREETMILGSDTLKPLVRSLVPEAEIVTRPRFSNLSYAGAKKLSRLPPRSAIVAFSAEEVYAIAELIRRTRGGAAIVMGALSPRTRNAQVAMFQAGEVDFLVATDAIGMGLNMDVGHVAFASLSKFDGQRQRRLSIAEMAQIAGRAGRHQRDGTFGTIAGDGANALTEIEIERIENHRFQPLDHLFWRDSDPDMSSVEALIASLETPPDRVELRLAPEATDLAVLKRLADDPEIASLAKGRVGRLWELCGLPDFRKVGPQFHAQLVGRLFGWLCNRDGRIPDDVLAGELTRLDSVQGDIAAIAQRIATARTWAYAAQRADWVQDPAHWSARAAALEERLSDALHEKLTQRFVDKRTRALARGMGGAVEPVDLTIGKDGTVRLNDEPIGTLHGFDFRVDPQARLGERKRLLAGAGRLLSAEIERRARALVADEDAGFALADPGAMPEIIWRGQPLMRLVKGDRLDQPRLALLRGISGSNEQEAVVDRLSRWLRGRIDQLVPALTQLYDAAEAPTSSGALRSVLRALATNGGHIDRGSHEAAIRALSAEDRVALRRMGVVVGSLDLYHPALLKPAPVALIAALRAATAGRPIGPLPMPGMGLLHRPSAALAAAAGAAGYRGFGDQMVRIDLVERVARALHEQRGKEEAFVPDSRLATSIGIGEETFTHILRALGFRRVGPAMPAEWRWRGLDRPARRPARPVNPSFAALGGWKGAPR